MAAIREPDKHQNNAFSKHIQEHHEGQTEVQFKVDIIRSYNKPLERQVRERVEQARLFPTGIKKIGVQ
jgi:uncharacterized coiled-coil DUF342 family protein